jgi:hypothetical protein
VPNNKIAAIHSQYGTLLQSLSDNWCTVVIPRRAANDFQVVLPSGVTSPYSVVPMFGPRASRNLNTAFAQTVADPDVVLITGLAHGTPDEFAGFLGELLYTKDSNKLVVQREVAQKFIHFFACSTANGLDGMFVGAKCAVFIGYSAPVRIENTSDAWLAKLVKCDAMIDFSLMQGNSVARAIQDAQDQYNLNGLDYIGVLLTSNPSNCTLALPPTGAAAARVIPSRDLPPANGIGSRTIQ